MSKLNKKVNAPKKETPKKEQKNVLEGNMTSPQEDTTEKNMTQAEFDAVKKQQDKAEKDGASTEKLKSATALLSQKFNLDTSYHVTNYKDAGKVVGLTLENKDFIVTVQIKDSEKHGLVFED